MTKGKKMPLQESPPSPLRRHPQNRSRWQRPLPTPSRSSERRLGSHEVNVRFRAGCLFRKPTRCVPFKIESPRDPAARCARSTGWQVSSCSESRLSPDGRASLEQSLRLAQSPFLSRAAPRHRKPTDLRPKSEIRWGFRRVPPPREGPCAGRLSVVFTQAAEPHASGCRGKIRWPWTPLLRILLSMRGRSPEATGTA